MQRFKGWVVKLGGSLARAPELTTWLRLLATTEVPCVVVPGGGPFTDATRDTQQHWGFDDPSAHRMAILGMAQFGLMLHALEPRLEVATSLPALQSRLERTHATLWLPSLDDVALMDGLPADWTVSADSIALWLAGRIAADQLALIKAVPAENFGDRVQDLAAAMVDPFFPKLHARIGCRLAIFGRHEFDGFGSMLRQE